MQTVSHHDRETAYRLVGGDGQTTLLVHGSGGSHRVWANQYGPDGCRPAVAVDLSGHGASEDVETNTLQGTVRAYVEDVAAVARATDAEILVGNSLGGAVVLQTILDGAYSPEGVVLAGTGARLPVHDSLRAALEADFAHAIEMLHQPDRLFHDADPTLIERSKAQLRETGQSVTARDFEACHHFDVRDRLSDIETPVLALVGEHDTLTPPSYHRTLASAVPDGTLRAIDDAAHMVMLERPSTFTAAVKTFRDGL